MRYRHRTSLRRLVASLAATAILLASALAGFPYVWCVPMARAQLHCCCHARPASARAALGGVVGATASRSCCEGRRVQSPPASTTSAPHDVAIAPSPLVARLALLDVLAPDSIGEVWFAQGLEHESRAGPEPPLYLLHQSLLN